MRSDIFQSRKCVHIKLTKEVHAALRAELFKRGLSMQEIFDEFAGLLVKEDPRATKIVEQLSMRKLQNKLDGIRRPKISPVGDLDVDTLYDLIDSATANKERGRIAQ